jgi:hypothetical protein
MAKGPVSLKGAICSNARMTSGFRLLVRPGPESEEEEISPVWAMVRDLARQRSQNRCLARWTVRLPHRGCRGGAGRANSKGDVFLRSSRFSDRWKSWRAVGTRWRSRRYMRAKSTDRTSSRRSADLTNPLPKARISSLRAPQAGVIAHESSMTVPSDEP